MRISEKLQRHREKYPDKPTFSYEYFVPKTSQGAQNLYDRMDRMYELTGPQFIDITWNAGGKKVEKKPIVSNGTPTVNGSSTKSSDQASSLSVFKPDAKPTTTDIIETCQTVLGLETCMHLTCTNMPLSEIDEALQKAYDSGCQNILALRGDPPLNGGDNGDDFSGDGDDASCFQYAKDLVKYIREKYGDHFDIGVAAYPEGHPEEANRELLLDYLHEKVECGANFIITQMFYDADIFIDWCAKVRARGINIPIIPGIMPITSYDSFLRRAKWCQINIPEQFLKELDPYRDDEQLLREVGTKLVVEMCSKLLQSNYVTHLHMYTMNLEKGSMVILQKIGALRKDALSSNQLWRRSLNPQRKNETVRPIFWQRRPYSYVARTSQWGADEFPNGRFGDPNSPAFGGLDLAGAQLIRQTGKRCLELWSQPTKVKDIGDLIINYLNGDLKCLPWSDTPITGEVDSIIHYLKNLNKKLIFTINSQPKVNGLPSSDKIFGWGPKNGFVYQKGYLEFLLPKNKICQFLELANNNEELTFFLLNNDNSIFYYKDGENGTINESVNYNCQTSTDSAPFSNGDASPPLSVQSSSSSSSSSSSPENGNKKRRVERKKSCDTDNLSGSRANAVTWGIFPGREVLQPTIVEKESFVAWRDEFYQILQEWKLNFQKFNAPESATLIGKIIDDYVLCNIVDNNFVSPENQIYSLLSELSE